MDDHSHHSAMDMVFVRFVNNVFYKRKSARLMPRLMSDRLLSTGDDWNLWCDGNDAHQSGLPRTRVTGLLTSD